MRASRVPLAFGLILALVASALVALPAAAMSQTCVNPGGTDGCYSSIQAAIDAVTVGGTVWVQAGTYHEGDIWITKSLTLSGAGMGQSIIDATGSTGAAITVQGVDYGSGSSPWGSSPNSWGAAPPQSKISGFTIMNATLEGIHLVRSSGVWVSNNMLTGNDQGLVAGQSFDDTTCPADPEPAEAFDCGEAIHLDGAAGSTVQGNVVKGNAGGILLSDEMGPTHDNVVSNNLVTGNILDCGIIMASHAAGTGIYHNLITHNISAGNGASGVGIYGLGPGTSTHDNLVIDNILTGNGQAGVSMHIHGPDVTLSGNTVTHNWIKGNGGDPDPAVHLPSIGIEIFSDSANGGGPIDGLTVAWNTIQDQQVGIYVGTGAMSQALRYNDLSGTVTGVDNAGTGTVDASWNYWGCAAGPGNAGCSGVMGTVTATPTAG